MNRSNSSAASRTRPAPRGLLCTAVLLSVWLWAASAQAQSTQTLSLSFRDCAQLDRAKILELVQLDLGQDAEVRQSTASQGTRIAVTCLRSDHAPDRITMVLRHDGDSATLERQISPARDAVEMSLDRVIALHATELYSEYRVRQAAKRARVRPQPDPAGPDTAPPLAMSDIRQRWLIELQGLGVIDENIDLGARLSTRLRLNTWLGLILGLQGTTGGRRSAFGEIGLQNVGADLGGGVHWGWGPGVLAAETGLRLGMARFVGQGPTGSDANLLYSQVLARLGYAWHLPGHLALSARLEGSWTMRAAQALAADEVVAAVSGANLGASFGIGYRF